MADRNGYIGRAPGDSSVIVARKVYEPTGVQTDFTFNSGYTPGYCDVYLNGVRLIDEKDFTASNGSTVGLTSAAQSGDVIELVVYKAYNLGVPLADVTGNLDVTGNISASSSITADGAFYGDGSNLSNIAGVAITQYIAANSLTVLGSPGVSTITRLGATDLNVTGIITANGLSGNVTGAALTITGNATFNSNVTIGGTLTYEDVTNVDALGIVTARAGVNVSGGQLLVGSGVTIGNAGVATFSGTSDVHLLDNVQLNVGDGSDLSLYHDGSHSYIKDSGTGNLKILSSLLSVKNPADNAVMIQATVSDSVDLYYDNSKKFETTNDGVVITGIATATSFTGTLNTAAQTNITSLGTLTGLIVGSGVTIGSAGVATFSGTADIHLHDGVRLKAGDSSDLNIYHESGNSYIEDSGTGGLVLLSNGTLIETKFGAERAIKCTKDAQVDIYYDDSIKFQTTLEGTATTGVTTVTESGTGNGMGNITAATASGGGNAGFKFATNSTGRFQVTTIGSAGAESLRLYDINNSAERLRIRETGNVFITGAGSTSLLTLYADQNTVYNGSATDGQRTAGTTLFMENDANANNTINQIVMQSRTGYEYNRIVTTGGSTPEMAICVNDGERLRIDSAGKVGIGTDNPDELLSLFGSANNVRLRIDSQNLRRNNYIGVSGADNLEIAVDEDNAGSASSLRIRIDAAERARLNSSGNLGIGTVSPARRLHLHDESSDTVQLHITNSTTGVSGSDGISFALGSDESLIINQRESNHISLKTADTERLRVASGGAVLIGGLTTQVSDTSKLAVAGGNTNIGIVQVHAGGGESDGDLAGITFSHGSGTTDTARAKCAIASRATGSYGKGDLCFYVDGTGDNNPVAAADERLRIGGSGQIGIAGANYGTSGQVLTSGGSGSAVSWADAGGGATEVIQSWDFGANYGQNYFETSATGITTSSGFIAYELIISGLQFVGSPAKLLGCRVYKSGGSLESGDSYQTYCKKSQFTSTSDENETANSVDKWTFMGTGNQDREFWDGSIKWKNPGYTTGKTYMPFMRAEWYQQARFAHFDICRMSGFANTDYISGIRVFNISDSTNLMSGRACLIGYKFA